MEQWDLAFGAPQLKAKQSMMQGELTRVFDVLNSLKQELAMIQESWEGEAGAIFCDSFQRRLREEYECAGRLGEVIDGLTRAEGEFERCEAEVLSLLG